MSAAGLVSSTVQQGFVFAEKKPVSSRFKYIHRLCQDELIRCLKVLGVDPGLALVEVTSLSEIKNVRGGPTVYFRSSTVYIVRGPEKEKEFVVREIITQKVTVLYKEVVISTCSLGSLGKEDLK